MERKVEWKVVDWSEVCRSGVWRIESRLWRVKRKVEWKVGYRAEWRLETTAECKVDGAKSGEWRSESRARKVGSGV